MRYKRVRTSGKLIFAWFVLTGLIFFFAPRSWTDGFRLTITAVLCKPLATTKALSILTLQSRSTDDSVPRSKYIRLRNQLANMKVWLKQEHQKVEKLSGLRDNPIWSGQDFILAEIISKNIGPSDGKLIINRGSADGLARGQFVLGDDSIVGTIAGLNSRTAQVNLFTDPASKMAVYIGEGSFFAKSKGAKSQQSGTMVMQGVGGNRAKIRLLPAKHKIAPGSVVFAQKKPGLLSAPMVVGMVESCIRDNENPLLWEVTVKPACRIDRLSEVTVIVPTLPD